MQTLLPLFYLVAVLPPLLGSVSPLSCWSSNSVQFAVLPPYLGSVSRLRCWSPNSVLFAVLVPLLGSVSPLHCWATNSVQFAVLVPLLGSVSLLHCWFPNSVPLSVLVPLLGSVSPLDCCSPNSVEYAVQSPFRSVWVVDWSPIHSRHNSPRHWPRTPQSQHEVRVQLFDFHRMRDQYRSVQNLQNPDRLNANFTAFVLFGGRAPTTPCFRQPSLLLVLRFGAVCRARTTPHVRQSTLLLVLQLGGVRRARTTPCFR